MPQVPGCDPVDLELTRDEKSFDNNDPKDEDEGVEKDVDVQGKHNAIEFIGKFDSDNKCYRLDSSENNGSEVEVAIINDYVESDSLEEDLQKAISTAERRKVFF